MYIEFISKDTVR